MRDDHRRKQRTEGNHDHADHLRTDLTEEFLQIYQHKARHNGSNHLSLIADHLHLCESEIPDRNLIRRSGCHGKTVQKLGGYQRQAEHDTQDLGGSHLLGDGPDDAYREQMEHRFTDQPQKVIGTGPELGNIRQALGPVVKKVDLTDDIAEAQNQTAADQGRNERSKNLSQIAHDPLNHVLVRLRRILRRVLAHALDPGICGKFVVESRNIVTDNNLILPRLGEGSLHGRKLSDCFRIRLFLIRQHEPHSGHAVGNRTDIFLSADQTKQGLYVLFILCHLFLLSARTCGSSGRPRRRKLRSCLNKFILSHLFKQVNPFLQKHP